MTRWILLACVALYGCPGPKEVEPLVSPTAWTVVPLERDPYAEFHPGPMCPATSFGEEDLGGEQTLFINAQDCAYLTMEQPALVEVEEGDLLHVRLWHFALLALNVSSATVAVTIDGRPIFQEVIPIPSESELLSPKFASEIEAGAGAPVLFHLRNHGSNSYNLIEISRGGEE